MRVRIPHSTVDRNCSFRNLRLFALVRCGWLTSCLAVSKSCVIYKFWYTIWSIAWHFMVALNNGRSVYLICFYTVTVFSTYRPPSPVRRHVTVDNMTTTCSRVYPVFHLPSTLPRPSSCHSRQHDHDLQQGISGIPPTVHPPPSVVMSQ